MNNTPQGEATEDNAADDTLMVDQGLINLIAFLPSACYFITGIIFISFELTKEKIRFMKATGNKK